MRHLIGIVCGSLVLTAPALADDNQVARGPAESWVTRSELLPVPDSPSGLIFMRRQDVIIHLDGKGQSQYVGYRMKLLHTNALQAGNVAITWNPIAGPPTIHAIKVYRGSETIDALASSSFEVLRREDQLETSHLNGQLTAVMHVPDLRVGDELEVELTVRSKDPTLGDKNAGVLLLTPDPQPGRYHLALNWTAGQEPTIRMTPDMQAVAVRQPTSVDFRFDNPRMQMPPKDAPPRYNWQRIVEFSDFADWATISRHFAPLYDKASTLGAGSPLKAEAAKIAAANATALDRMRAALKLVQRDVRYVFIGLNGGNLTPANADETWQRRYGDCKAKSALLLALLRELGISAEAVIASNSGNDDGLDQRLPSTLLFDHVLVRVKVDGQTYWLDGTLPPVFAPSVKPLMPYRWVLPVATNGQGLVELPWHPAAVPDEINLYQLDASGGFAKYGKVVQTSIVRGVDAVQQYQTFSAATPDQLLEGFRQQLVGDQWQSIDEVSWKFDEKAQASVLKIAGTGKIDWDDESGGTKSLALPGGGFSPPDRRVRAGADPAVPFYRKPSYDCSVTTVVLPKTTKPGQWSVGSHFDTRLFGANYYRAFEIRDGSARMIRGFRVETPEIDMTRATRDNARIAAFDNSKANLSFDAASTVAPKPAANPVPTTSSLDWTALDVPCVAFPVAGSAK